MRQPKDYKKGKIYVIRNHTNDKVYVGSTTQTLSRRFSYHKGNINTLQKRNRKIYMAMREIGFENFYIELIEDYPCENVEQLEAREGRWMRDFDSYNNGYNCKIAGRSKKEYYEENKEVIFEKNKQYYEENRGEILEKQKEYNEKNKDKVLEYKKEHYLKNRDKILEKHHNYRENNREKIVEIKKQYYEKNKKKISERMSEKIKCECGSEVCRGALPNHRKTKKHQDALSQKL